MSLPEIKALIIATSAYFGQRLDDIVVTMYAEDLADLPVAEIQRALLALRRDPKTTRFPLPATIRDRIAPAPTEENDAAEAAARIAGAARRFGYTNPERAREFIGELGWRVVQLDGGWQNVCETLTEDNLGTFRAQWRQLALATQRRAKSGQLGQAPALPTPARGEGGLTQLGAILPAPPEET